MKKAKFLVLIVMFTLCITAGILGVYASQSVSDITTSKVIDKLNNNIETTSNELILSATAKCTHVEATSGNGVTGSDISNYFKVIYNGSTQTQSQIKELIAEGVIVVNSTSGNIEVSEGLVRMKDVSTSVLDEEQSISISLKFANGDSITKSGTGKITRLEAGQSTNTIPVSESNVKYTDWTTKSCTTGSDCRHTGYDTQTRDKSYIYTTECTVVTCDNPDCNYVYCIKGGESYSKTETETRVVSNSRTGSHDWNEVYSGKEATCYSTGVYAMYKCSLCDLTSGGETYGPVDHCYTEKKTLSSGNCKVRSIYCFKCKWCDETQSVTYYGAYGEHVYYEGVGSDCQTLGIKYCSTCGAYGGEGTYGGCRYTIKHYDDISCSGAMYLDSDGNPVCDKCGYKGIRSISTQIWSAGMYYSSCTQTESIWTG